MIGAILAHIDFFDEQIERISDAIEEQLAPFSPEVELLCAVPGILLQPPLQPRQRACLELAEREPRNALTRVDALAGVLVLALTASSLLCEVPRLSGISVLELLSERSATPTRCGRNRGGRHRDMRYDHNPV